MSDTQKLQPDETQWLISQAPEHKRPGDECLPPVRLDASTEAFNIIEILRAGSAVENGAVIISHWAKHQLALYLVDLVAKGFGSDRAALSHGEDNGK